MSGAKTCRQCGTEVALTRLERVQGETTGIRVEIDGLPAYSCARGHKRFLTPEFPLRLIKELLRTDGALAGPHAVKKGPLRKHCHCPSCEGALGSEAGTHTSTRRSLEMYVGLAREAGLIKLGRLGVDGTKIRANASKRKAMSYGRMKEEEVRLNNEIARLLRQVEATDVAEDAEHGAQHPGNELPEELKRREQRLKAIQAAKERLEKRQRQADAEDGRSKDDEGNTHGPTGRRCKREFGIPQDKDQENFTDPQSRIMKTSEGYQQCYNGQAAVDEDNQLIVVADLGNNASDNGQLSAMLEQTKANVGASPQMMTLADTGYASEETLREWEVRGLAACVALGREDKKPG